MDGKKWLLRAGYGLLIYIIFLFFYGAATTGGIIWEVIGVIVVGVFGLYLSEKILNSSYWTCSETEKGEEEVLSRGKIES